MRERLDKIRKQITQNEIAYQNHAECDTLRCMIDIAEIILEAVAKLKEQTNG